MNTAVQQPAPHVSADECRAVFDRGARRKLPLITAAVGCFVLTLIVCLVQNFSHSSIDQSWSFDSSHYLNSAQMLFTVWQHVLQHGLNGSGADLLKPLAADLLLDGPVMPCLGALVLIVTNKALNFAHAPLFIMLQSFFNACAAATLCITATRFTGSRRWGALAGILWALYPPAVIAAGKFMTETSSALLMMGLVLIFSLAVEPARRMPSRVGLSLAAGVITACIWLLKGALAPATALVVLIALAHSATFKNRALLASVFTAGLIIALLPWMAFTRTATGHVQIMAQRVPVLNAVYGLDPDTDGWGSLTPPSPWQKALTEEDGLLPATIAMVTSDPGEAVSLVLRKTTRLWEAPSNDYHRKFFRIMPPIVQGWWHDAVILCGLLGLLLYFAVAFKRREVAPSVRFIGAASAAAIAAHLIFAVFGANTRYGFTAMPFFILFAVYGLARLAERRVFSQPVLALACAVILEISLRHGLMDFFAAITHHTKLILTLELSSFVLLLLLAIGFAAAAIKRIEPNGRIRTVGKFALGAGFLLLLVPLVANHTSDRTIREWTATLHPGQMACRRVMMPAGIRGQQEGRWLYVVFDGDETSSTAVVRVNGTALAQKPEPICDSGRQEVARGFRDVFAKLLRQRPEVFRQWQVVPVPASLLRDEKPNTISLEPGSSQVLNLHGDFPGWSQADTVPSLTFFSATKLCNEPAPLDARPAAVLNRPLAAGECWLRANDRDYRDLSNWPGVQFGRYRLLLLTGFARDKNGEPDINAASHRIW